MSKTSNGFPVLSSDKRCAKLVDITKLNDDWAVKIHSQTLVELASRGGLCPREIRLNIDRGQLAEIMNYERDKCIDLVNSISFNVKN